MAALGRIAFAISLPLLAAAICAHFLVSFWGDQDWELLVARMILQGRHLYTGHVTVSPPFIYWLYMLPEALAMHTAFLQDYQILTLLGLCAAIASIAICCLLLNVHPGFSDGTLRMQFAALMCFLLIFRVAPAYFADREHLFVTLTFPYLLRWMPSLARHPYSIRLRTIIGILAGIGFCTKPHCLIVLAGVQLACLVRKDRPHILASIESCAIYAICAFYLLSIYVFTPEYFSLILPMARLTYFSISADTRSLFNVSVAISLALTFAMFRPGHTSPYRKDIYYLLQLSAFMLAYALLNQGWGYTYEPIITLLLLVNAFVLWEFLYLRRAHASHQSSTRQFACGAGLCLVHFGYRAAITLAYLLAIFALPCRGDTACPGYYAPFIGEFESLPQPRSFGMIGMNFPLWARVSKLSGAEWETRFSQLWMVPKFFVSDEDFFMKNRWIIDYVTAALADDLERKKPQLVFVELSQTLYTIRMRDPVDWVARFSMYPDFSRAWEHYAYVHTIDVCDESPPVEAVQAMLSNGPSPPRSNCRFAVYRRDD